MKKLYRVDVAYSYYCIAEDETEAELLADEAWALESTTDIATAHDQTEAKHLVGIFGWSGDSLVFQQNSNDPDIKLSDAFEHRKNLEEGLGI